MRPDPIWAEDVDLLKAREIQRLAETQLEDVIALATSGDSRAATLAAAMSAISAALLAAAVTILGFTAVDAVAVGSLVGSSAAFIIAGGLAVWSARPTDFYLRGYNPAALIPQPGDELMIVKWVTEDVARRIEHNRQVLARAGRLMNLSYAVSAAGIFLPLIVVTVHLLLGSSTFG